MTYNQAMLLSEIESLESQIEEQKKQLEKKDSMLDQINNIMWKTWAVKGKDFDGFAVMEVLEQWASKQDNKNNS